MSLTRRELLTAGAALALGAAVVSAGALPPFTTLAIAADTNPSPEDLAHAGPGGDIMIGSEKAPVTIVEYASMTCPHCAHFEETTLPELKKRYIDTGKVRYVFREFPLDALAAAGFTPARCRPGQIRGGGRNAVRQASRLGDGTETDPTADGDRQAVRLHRGILQYLLVIKKRPHYIQAVRDHAVNKLGVNSTPTFFINGKRLVGDLSIDVMAKEIDPYLKEG